MIPDVITSDYIAVVTPEHCPGCGADRRGVGNCALYECDSMADVFTKPQPFGTKYRLNRTLKCYAAENASLRSVYAVADELVHFHTEGGVSMPELEQHLNALVYTVLRAKEELGR